MDDHSLAQLPPYTTIDFKDLAKSDEAFNTLYQKSSGRLNFQDPTTTLLLSKALLKIHFNLTLNIPPDRLCPPIPNRWNYVSWIHQLLDSTSPSYTNTYDPQRHITGLDIGTGASAIYTILCLRSRPNWTMCATDVDEKSFSSAIHNLTINNLLPRAKLLQTIPSNLLIPLQRLAVQNLDFTICNPPFFSSPSAMQASLSGSSKAMPPAATCTGAETEMVCPGGDFGFVKRILEESLILREKISWYTTIFGHLESLKGIIALLKEKQVDNYAVGTINVGNGTKRWVLGWSFGDLRPRNGVARGERVSGELLPFPTEYKIDMGRGCGVEVVVARLGALLAPLDLVSWQWRGGEQVGVGEAAQIVWNRAYRRDFERRKRQWNREQEEEVQEGPEAEMRNVHEKKVALAFRIKVEQVEERGEENPKSVEADEGAGSAVFVVIEWLRGRDQVIWESFCGWLRRGMVKD